MKMDTKSLPQPERKIIEKALRLNRKEEHRVFVYGTLLTGEKNAHWAGNARRQPAWTSGAIYDTGYGFPAFVKEGRKRVPGEVLTVDDEGFRSMDRLEGYPRLYRREQIRVNLAGGGRVLAWVYMMNKLPKGASLIPGGDWRKRNAADDKR